METRITSVTMVMVFISLCSKLYIQAQQVDVCRRNEGAGSTFLYFLSESAEPGTAIGNLPLEGYAGDTQGQPNISLVLDGEDKEYVYIDNELKALRLNTSIDADSEPRIQQLMLTVGCLPLTTEDARVLSYTVFIDVKDENDNAPEFIGAPYSFNLSELTEPQTVVFSGVAARDADASSNSQVLYRVLPNVNDPDSNKYFSFLNSGRPDLSLILPLDYETKQSFEVLIEARDKGTVPNMNTTTINVTILDGDDQGPVFLPCLSSENSTECAPFNYLSNVTEKRSFQGPLTFWPGQIEAADGDTGVANPAAISYSFGEGEPSNYAEYLAIDAADGSVTLLQPVKHSEIQEFRITLIATEGANSTEAKSSTTRVIITVDEINVHSPQFPVTSVVAYVREGVTLGSPIWTTPDLDTQLILVASDPDLGDDETFRVSYMLNDPSGAFILSSSNHLEARIVTNDLIDREREDAYTLKLMAKEASTTAQFVSQPITINITVLDTNDNPPVFLPNEYSTAPNRYMAVIRQNVTSGSVVMEIEVSDIDTAPRMADYTYGLETLSFFPDGSPFEQMSLNTVAKIVLIRDASEIPKGDYVLSIQASDVDNPALLSLKAMIDIKIIGVDDTRGPVFDLEEYETYTSEGVLVGSLITTVTARSLDNLPISYSFVDSEEHFTIGSASGEILLLKRLDRESQVEHRVTVRARSGGKVATADVVIKIVDVNDNSPKLNASVPSVFLIVEGQKDYYIGQIAAYDEDKPGTLNSQVWYSLESEYFSIDMDTGDLSTSNVALEVVSMERLKLEVTLHDMGSPEMSSVAVVTVIVQDVNNYRPVFEYPEYKVQIQENFMAEDFLQLKVLDRNVSDTFRFVLLDGDEGLFHLDTTSGTLSLKSTLDYEGRKSYPLRVAVFDGNNERDITNITVHVTDVNDNAPTFNQSLYEGDYEAFALAGTVIVGDIQAYDLDEPGTENSLISYSLLSAENVFRLENSSSPVILTADHMNLTQSVFMLTIVAADHGKPSLSSTAEVIIRPRLIHPVFDENPIRVTTLFEGMPKESLVTTLQARSNVGDVVKYSIISGNFGDVFSIRSVNNVGQIYTAKELDRESRSSYTLEVLAEINTSKQTPAIRTRRALDPSIVYVMIEIGDVNDNPPTFAQERYYAGVSVKANVGSFVTLLQASDLDAEPGDMRYGIQLLSNNATKFKINQHTGVLVTTATFTSNEAEKTYTLNVTAEDRSSEQLKEASTILLVSVINSTNRIIITINLTLDVVEKQRGPLEEELSMLFSAHAFIDDISQHRTGAGFQQFDPSSSDISIYVLEDSTARPWHNNNTLRVLQERRDQLENISHRLLPGGKILEIRKPRELERGLVVVTRGHPPEGVLLLILAIIILFLTVLASIIILISWKKREREREENRIYLPMQYSTFNPYKQSTEDLEMKCGEENADPCTSSDVNTNEPPDKYKATTSNPVFFEGQDNHSMHMEATSQVELFPNGAEKYLREKEVQEYAIEFGPEDDEATAVAKKVIYSGTMERSQLNGSIGSGRDSSPSKTASHKPVSYEHSTSQEPLIAPDTPESDDGMLDDSPLPPPPDFSLPNVPEQPSRRAPSPPVRSPSPSERDYSKGETLPARMSLSSYQGVDNPGMDLSDETDAPSTQDPLETEEGGEVPPTTIEGGESIENSRVPVTGHYNPKTPQGHVDTDDLHVALIRVSQSEDDLSKLDDNKLMTTFKQPEGSEVPPPKSVTGNYVSMVSPAPFRSPGRDADIPDVDEEVQGKEELTVNDNLREYEELQAGVSSFDEWESEGSVHSTQL